MINKNKKANVNVEEGTVLASVGSVTMTIEAYNDLMKELNTFRNSVTVVQSWREEIDIKIDTKAFYNIAKDLVAEEYPDATMRIKREVYEVTTAIASMPPTEEDQE